MYNSKHSRVAASLPPPLDNNSVAASLSAVAALHHRTRQLHKMHGSVAAGASSPGAGFSKTSTVTLTNSCHRNSTSGHFPCQTLILKTILFVHLSNFRLRFNSNLRHLRVAVTELTVKLVEDIVSVMVSEWTSIFFPDNLHFGVIFLLLDS